MGSMPTRFGSREQLHRCVAIQRANGLDVFLDMVEHHRDGDPRSFVFRYRGAESRFNSPADASPKSSSEGLTFFDEQSEAQGESQ